MSVSLFALNKALKAWDRTVYARQTKDGIVRVFQKTKQWREHWLDGETCIRELCDGEWLLCSLTDNWSANGEPRDWGILPVLAHLREGSYQRQDELERELKAERERVQESKERELKNISETAAKEMWSDCKHAFKDTVVHGMDMSKDVRRKYDNRRK